MNTVTLVGIDLGRHSFHLHGQDASGRMVFRKKLSRSQMLTMLANSQPVVSLWRRVLVPTGLPDASR